MAEHGGSEEHRTTGGRVTFDRVRGAARHPVTALFVGAVLLRLLAVAVLGPRLSPDSYRYLAQANDIVRQGPSGFLTVLAAGPPLYGLYLAVLSTLGTGGLPWSAALGQVLLGAATVLLVARFTARGTGSTRVGLLAGTMAAVHMTFLFWTAYVLTDTLFLFALALSADRLLAIPASRHVIRDAAAATLAVGLVLLVRPTAPAFAAALPLYLLVAGWGNARRLRRIFAGFLLPLVAGAGVLLAGMLLTGPALISRSYDRTQLYLWFGLYAGLNWTEQGWGMEGVDFTVPPGVALVPGWSTRLPSSAADGLASPTDETSLSDGESAAILRELSMQAIVADPSHVLRLWMDKLRIYWAPFLPEYSFVHKVVKTLYLVPLYLLALVGLYASRKDSPFFTLSLVGLLAFTLTSMLTVVDPDQRYRLPAELFVVSLGGVGLARVSRRLIPSLVPPEMRPSETVVEQRSPGR